MKVKFNKRDTPKMVALEIHRRVHKQELALMTQDTYTQLIFYAWKATILAKIVNRKTIQLALLQDQLEEQSFENISMMSTTEESP